ncbi:hypothetical protein [Actinoallomurus sp. CA-142502]|uniref:hypothetical protein n=1 Tax=Actinoallomurus sp. CA-142502 TaxID=3239885 RepID=UPI003D91083B
MNGYISALHDLTEVRLDDLPGLDLTPILARVLPTPIPTPTPAEPTTAVVVGGFNSYI